MQTYDVIILPLAERDIDKTFFYINKEKQTVYVLRVLHMLVDAKPLLLNLKFI